MRDLVEIAIDMVREEKLDEIEDRAELAAEDRLVDLLAAQGTGTAGDSDVGAAGTHVPEAGPWSTQPVMAVPNFAVAPTLVLMADKAVAEDARKDGPPWLLDGHTLMKLAVVPEE